MKPHLHSREKAEAVRQTSAPVAQPPARQRPYEFRVFDAGESRTVQAIAACVFPSDDRPGAREACVVNFIDHMLATHYAARQEEYHSGIRMINELARKRFKVPFADLPGAQQETLLRQLERGEVQDWPAGKVFFAMVRLHTVEGMFSDPKYHGNAGGVGWKLVQDGSP